MDEGTQNFDIGDKSPGTTPTSEVHSMEVENAIRAEHGLAPRPSYYDHKGPYYKDL